MNRTAYITFKFLVELCLAAALYGERLERRRRFPLRVGAAGLLLGLTAWLISPVNLQYHLWPEPWTTVMSISRYLLLFAELVLALWGCFYISFQTAVFVSTGAYAIQHMSLKTYSFLETLWLSGMPLAVVAAVYALFMLGSYALFAHLVVRRLDVKAVKLRADETVLFNLLMIVSLIVLSVFISKRSEQPMLLRLAEMGYGIVCGGFLLCMQTDMFAKSSLRAEKERIETILAQEHRQFESFRAGVEYLDIKCHDLKHQIHRLKSGRAMNDETIAELEDGIARYESYANTGSTALDLVIGEKFLLCARDGIDFVPAVRSARLSLFSEPDIYSLFGNALDNAIEYERTMPEGARFIRLNVTDLAGMLFIRVENGYQGQEISSLSQLVTTKEDRTSHGFGVKSMRYLAEKYDGQMEVETHDGLFCLTFAFPVPENQKEDADRK